MIMSRSKYLRPILSTGLLGALLLSGCTTDTSEPSPPATSSEKSKASTPEPTDAEPSGSQSPAEPKLERPKRPTGIEKTDAEAAILTAEHFIDVYNYSLQSRTVEDLKALSSDNCGFCKDTIDDIETFQKDGHIVQGGKIKRSEGRINPDAISDHEMDVFLDFSQELTSISTEDGTVVSTFAAGDHLVKVHVELAGTSWQVIEVFGERK